MEHGLSQENWACQRFHKHRSWWPGRFHVDIASCPKTGREWYNGLQQALIPGCFEAPNLQEERILKSPHCLGASSKLMLRVNGGPKSSLSRATFERCVLVAFKPFMPNMNYITIFGTFEHKNWKQLRYEKNKICWIINWIISPGRFRFQPWWNPHRRHAFSASSWDVEMLGLQKFIYLSYESYVISCEVGIMLDWYDDMFTMLGVSDWGIHGTKAWGRPMFGDQNPPVQRNRNGTEKKRETKHGFEVLRVWICLKLFKCHS